jgi:hypothetical protein
VIENITVKLVRETRFRKQCSTILESTKEEEEEKKTTLTFLRQYALCTFNQCALKQGIYSLLSGTWTQENTVSPPKLSEKYDVMVTT